MKRNKNKRIWNDLLLAACLLLLCIFLACGGFGMLKPAQAESGDPYDWTDYDGEVILDDPEFFMFTEDDEAEEQENAEEAAAPAEETQDEGEQEPSEQPADPVQDDPAGEQPGASAEEPGEQPAGEPEDQPAEEPGESPAEQPTEEPAQTEEPPAPVDLKTMFKVEIKVPADWTNAKAKNIRVKITALTGSAWDKVKYRLDSGDWVEIKEKFTLLDGYYYVDLEVTNNAVMTVRLLDAEGNFMDEKKEIRIFDRLAPVVTAGFNDKLLHVEAPDDLSGAAGVQVNGLLFTTLENGQLDVRMEDLLLTYPQLAIRAYDYAGNFSEPITLDNPYYVAPTPTPKATKKPNPKPTAVPTEAPKPTKKPSGGKTQDTDKPAATKEPAAPAATPEPVVIIVTQPPVVTPEPIVKTEYVPLGPGHPFTGSGNMQTLDVLYSASTNKQFITVQSKKGQTYYMVIDYDKPIDEANEIYETYFLNMVDDRDLQSVLSDDEIVATPTPQIVYVTPEPTAVPAVTPDPTPQTEKPAFNQSALFLLLIVLLGGGGAAYWFLKKKKDAPKPRMMDESGFDDEEDEEINTEENENE